MERAAVELGWMILVSMVRIGRRLALLLSGNRKSRIIPASRQLVFPLLCTLPWTCEFLQLLQPRGRGS